MNILVISHEFPPIGGGGANACYFLTKGYVTLGHKVTVITAKYQQDKSIEDMQGVHIVRVKALRKHMEKSSFLEMLSFLVKAWQMSMHMAKRVPYDVCHVFFGIPSGPIALHLKKKYHIPYIVRFGGGDIPGAQKRFALVYKILEPAIRSIWKQADYLIANSEGLCARAMKFEDRYPIQIIPNGVDVEFFTREEQTGKRGKSHKIELLCVSRLIEGKGLQDIIPFMLEINQRTCRQVILRIVGDGPYRTELERITRETSMLNFVFFEGRKNQQDLLPYYQNADIFILPSRSEGMPNVVLEAMSTGLPIIITPCEGSKELVTDNGYIVPKEQFIEKVITLCTEDEGRLEMGNRSSQIVHQDYLWLDKAREYTRLMEQCLAGE